PVAAGREDLGAAAGLVEGGDRHGDHAVAEGDQDEGAEELRQQLSPHPLPAGGQSLGPSRITSLAARAAGPCWTDIRIVTRGSWLQSVALDYRAAHVRTGPAGLRAPA